MAKSSIHIIAVKNNSEIHNKRLKDYDYVRKDLEHLNVSWERESLKQARKRIKKTYEKSTGQRLQKKATPLREGVVNLNEEHTMEDLLKLKDILYERFKIKTIQIYIHRDEGYQKVKKGEWKQNLHAHMVFDWTDEKGKTLKLNRWQMTQMQDLISETLGMERGVKSNKKHLSAIGYKVQEIEKDIEVLSKKVQEYINLITPENIEDYFEKTFFGKRINEDKLQDLILSEKSKSSIIEEIQKNNEQLNQETKKITLLYKEKIHQLEEIEKNLEKEKNNYLVKSEVLAKQQEDFSKFKQLKAELEAIKPKYEKLKRYEGLTSSKRFIEESISFRNMQEDTITKLVLEELKKYTFRNKSELLEVFRKEMKKHGFYEQWDNNPFFDKYEATLHFEYKNKGLRL